MQLLLIQWHLLFDKPWEKHWTQLIHSFSQSITLLPAFPLRRLARTAALGRLEITHGQQQSHTSAFSTPRREMYSLHLVLGWPLGRFPVGVASRICLANRSWDILDAWTNQRSWDLAIRWSGSTLTTLRISQLRSVAKCPTVNCSQKSHLCRLHLG